jgi:hypothetical protein
MLSASGVPAVHTETYLIGIKGYIHILGGEKKGGDFVLRDMISRGGVITNTIRSVFFVPSHTFYRRFERMLLLPSSSSNDKPRKQGSGMRTLCSEKWRQRFPPKRRQISTRLQDVTSQKRLTFRSWYLVQFSMPYTVCRAGCPVCNSLSLFERVVQRLQSQGHWSLLCIRLGRIPWFWTTQNHAVRLKYLVQTWRQRSVVTFVVHLMIVWTPPPTHDLYPGRICRDVV